MKELREILNKLNNLTEIESPVLATVVDVKGSSFRLPGAKMLILDDGTTVGTVSGGCLEADVLERAGAVRADGKPALFVYDTTNEENSIFSLNMGCRGIIRILMEPVAFSPVAKFLHDNFEDSVEGVIATVIGGDKLGSQMIVDTNGIRHSSFSDPSDSQRVLVEADSVLQTKKSRLVVSKVGEVFYDYLAVPVSLTIFGAGSDAVPLSRMASELGWRTQIVDHRSAFATAGRFPTADLISNPPRESLGTVDLAEQSLAVVMTHNFENDKLVMTGLLKRRLRYIGAMGPKSRTERMLSEIEETGFALTEEMRSRIYGPVGLDIGATTPEGIALAILAEIQTVLSNRDGGFLREREGSIYGRS